jgi:NAD(P)-dependent dehydrogenase (short-subunit alcohol dehydrogenase family)
MKGNIALVTGANGGLGTFVTQALRDAGATVVGLSQRIQQSAFNSPNFTALPADISTSAGVKSALDSLVSRFGRLDILAHTVGGFAGGQSIAATDDATFQRMFDVNLYSTFYLLRGAVPVMRQAKRTHRCHRQPRCSGTWSRRRRLQRFKAAMVSLIRTVAQENKDAGNDRQCHPGRYAADAGQPEIHA